MLVVLAHSILLFFICLRRCRSSDVYRILQLSYSVIMKKKSWSELSSTPSIADLRLAHCSPISLSPLAWTNRPSDKQCQMLLQPQQAAADERERGQKKKKRGESFHPHSFSCIPPPSKAPSSTLTVVGKCVFDREKYIFTLGPEPSASS